MRPLVAGAAGDDIFFIGPSPSSQQSCAMTSEATTLPEAPPRTTQYIDGLTSDGGLIVVQAHVAGIGDTLEVYDPRTGTVRAVVSEAAREPGLSHDADRALGWHG